MFGLGFAELLVILVIVLLLFGASRLPTIARSVGNAITEFKKGMQGAGADIDPPAHKDGEKK